MVIQATRSEGQLTLNLSGKFDYTCREASQQAFAAANLAIINAQPGPHKKSPATKTVKEKPARPALIKQPHRFRVGGPQLIF